MGVYLNSAFSPRMAVDNFCKGVDCGSDLGAPLAHVGSLMRRAVQPYFGTQEEDRIWSMYPSHYFEVLTVLVWNTRWSEKEDRVSFLKIPGIRNPPKHSQGLKRKDVQSKRRPD